MPGWSRRAHLVRSWPESPDCLSSNGFRPGMHHREVGARDPRKFMIMTLTNQAAVVTGGTAGGPATSGPAQV